MHVCYLHKQSNDGWISPMINAVKRHFVFAFRFGFFFLPFKITKSQSFGSISFVNIYSYISSYNRCKGMPGLFNCQLTKRFLHSVLCCCVETLKKTTPECHTTAFSWSYMYSWEFSCNCVNTNYFPWVTVNCVQNENQMVQLFLCGYLFLLLPKATNRHICWLDIDCNCPPIVLTSLDPKASAYFI